MNTVRPRRDPGRGYAYGGPALIGGILVGSGLGILLDDFFAWFLIGIGAGFTPYGVHRGARQVAHRHCGLWCRSDLPRLVRSVQGSPQHIRARTESDSTRGDDPPASFRKPDSA